MVHRFPTTMFMSPSLGAPACQGSNRPSEAVQSSYGMSRTPPEDEHGAEKTASYVSSPGRRTTLSESRRAALERRFRNKRASSPDSKDDEKKQENSVQISCEAEATPLISNRAPKFRVAKAHLRSDRDGQGGLFSKSTQACPHSPSEEENQPIRQDDMTSDQSQPRYASPKLPQHETLSEAVAYYRVVFRGVVALLSSEDCRSPRSGVYVSYGDIFCSNQEITSHDDAATAESGRCLQTGGALASQVLRVDAVLTGGYAIDAADDVGVASSAETPKRSNSQHTGTVAISPGRGSEEGLGFLVCRQDHVIVAERLSTVPVIEAGSFVYKVTSSSPLSILTGPALDAPLTKALILPGSVHEISLRVLVDPSEDVWFLRLSHRRGWIADKKVVKKGKTPQLIVVVNQVDNGTSSLDDGSVSCVSSVATTVTAPSPRAQRRHRPPRRLKETPTENIDKGLPRHIVGSAKERDRVMTPSSNVSIMSDDSSLEQNASARSSVPVSPDISYATAKSAGSSSSSPASCFYLIRVTAPRGLKILDAPHFQVNNLIHGKSENLNVSSSHLVSQMESSMGPPKAHHSIFQTMSGRLATTGPSNTGCPAIFDASSKTRILPRGALFEASRRVENTGVFCQGAGLIKLSDNSGWAIVPRQDELDSQYRNYSGTVANVKEGEATRAFEEVGNAALDTDANDTRQHDRPRTIWLRVVHRSGVQVTSPPPVSPGNEDDPSPTSSRGSSAVNSSHHGSSFYPPSSADSDVASSVGSSFLDSLFRTPKKKKDTIVGFDPLGRPPIISEKQTQDIVIQCGMCVEVERWVDARSASGVSQEFARLRGGQGWLPITLLNKHLSSPIPRPDFRFGSFWFRVQASRGIKVRQGPSRKAPSIKSDDGVYFRFECGEFLRASEVVTIFSDEGAPVEAFAKLYRNRHVRLHADNEDYRQLSSLTTQAEWVMVHSSNELYLEQCAEEPRIERHKQGWRYNVVPEDGVSVRKGPSFASEKTGTILFGGESLVINERVSPAGDKITWLRMKDGQGWVHDVDAGGDQTMIAHSLRHRSHMLGRPQKTPVTREGSEIAYNAIVARLFEGPSESYPPKPDIKRSGR